MVSGDIGRGATKPVDCAPVDTGESTSDAGCERAEVKLPANPTLLSGADPAAELAAEPAADIDEKFTNSCDGKAMLVMETGWEIDVLLPPRMGRGIILGLVPLPSEGDLDSDLVGDIRGELPFRSTVGAAFAAASRFSKAARFAATSPPAAELPEETAGRPRLALRGFGSLFCSTELASI